MKEDINLAKLKGSYHPDRANLNVMKDTSALFSGTLPKDTFVLESLGATLKTNKGHVVDFSSMVLNCLLGQNDPWVNANLIAYLQSGRPSFLSISLGGSEIYYQYAKRLAELKIGGIDDPVINFRQCNGSDAVEAAILAAKTYAIKNTKQEQKEARELLVSFKGSYHGQSLAPYLVSDVLNHNVFLVEKSKNVLFLDRPTHAKNIEEEKLTDEESGILKQLEVMSQKVFAVLIEPIQMNSGAHAFSKAFLRGLNTICHNHDICFILDEIQTGMGWLGKLTAAEKLELKPDIVALGKGLTGGYGPLSLIVANKKYNCMPDRTVGKTNGADIRSLVAANALLDRVLGISKEKIQGIVTEGTELYQTMLTGLLSRVPAIEKILDENLKKIKTLFGDNIGEIRGCGVIRTIQILNRKTKQPDKKLANTIHLNGVKQGIFIRNNESELLIKVPIAITDSELKIGFQNLIRAINATLLLSQYGLSTDLNFWQKKALSLQSLKDALSSTPKLSNDISHNFQRTTR